MAAVWKRLEKRSKNAYVAGIQQYLRVFRGRSELGVKGALEEALLQVVRAGHYEGPIKRRSHNYTSWRKRGEY